MDRYAVETVVIRASDMSTTGYRVSAKITPTNYLHRDVRSPLCAKYRNNLILAVFNLTVGWLICQIAKFNSPPNFPAIRYEWSPKAAQSCSSWTSKSWCHCCCYQALECKLCYFYLARDQKQTRSYYQWVSGSWYSECCCIYSQLNQTSL